MIEDPKHYSDYNQFPDDNRTLERVMNEQPMSAAEFWWNHLTYRQREFISKIIGPKVEEQKIPMIMLAYNQSTSWNQMPGWPALNESDMRKI